MGMMGTTTLRDIARAYLEAGWHPLELPAHAKAPPPDGRTGHAGVDMVLADVLGAAWTGNIGTRMPTTVIGLDIDVYRGGKATLDALIAKLGALPKTWISHSGRNDGSGIRFFRVPAGMSWVAALPGIDIIQRDHRYAVLYPSTHPDGRQYGIWDQHEGAPGTLPPIDELPDLPWAWINELSRPTQHDAESGAGPFAVTFDDVQAFLLAHTRADAPGYIATIVAHFHQRRGQGFSRHDTMQHCLLWAMECARADIADALTAIETLAVAWQTAHPDDPRRAEIQSDRRVTEFDAMVRHAVGKVLRKTDAEIRELHDDIAGPTFNVPAPEPVPAPAVADDPAAGYLDWHAFFARDAGERQWLVEGLWPMGRAIAIWATAKAGKSELLLWVAANLAMGRDPWTLEQITPVDISYFDYEMTEDDLDDRLSAFGFTDPDLLGRLHYDLLPALFPLDTERGGEQVEQKVRAVGSTVAIFDTFGRAVTGDENEADTVRAFYRFTGSRLKRLGVSVARTDHAGKDTGKGQRGSSAKREDIDVIWHLTRRQGGVNLSCAGSSRVSWVPEHLTLDRVEVDGVLRYATELRIGWPEGTAELAALLDRLGVPVEMGHNKVRDFVKAIDPTVTLGRSDLLLAAVKYRRSRAGTGQPDLYTDTDGYQ